jgi:hypothetical protein
MPTLSYKAEGRFGNNLIQYCIAKLLCKLFGHTLISRHERGSLVLTDFEWKLLVPSLLENQNNPEFFRKHPYSKKNLRLEGFFQDSRVLSAFRPTLLTFFTIDNPDSINPKITVKDLVLALHCTPRFDEIVVHLRMDDFSNAGKDHSSLILHPNYFQEVLTKAKLQYSLPVRILFERKNNPKEDAYLNQFLPYSPIFQSADLLMDFATLAKARVLVSSNSTFAWMAGFLAEDQKRYLPTISHMGNQYLGKIEDTDEVKESFFITL